MELFHLLLRAGLSRRTLNNKLRYQHQFSTAPGNNRTIRAIRTGERAAPLVPAPIVTEVAYFLQIDPAPAVEAVFLDPLARSELIAEATIAQDFARIADLVRQYADLPLVTADASVIAAAERLGAAHGFRAAVRPCRSRCRSVGCGRARP